jgi:hypothetical protein
MLLPLTDVDEASEQPDAVANKYDVNTPTLNVNPLFDADEERPLQAITPAPCYTVSF